MKFLFIAKQKKNIDAFEGTIAHLLASGHEVALAIQDRDEDRDNKLLDTFTSPGFSLQTCPASRSDGWIVQAPLIRRVRDWVQYLKPEYTGAAKLRRRAVDKLQRELGPTAHPLGSSLTATLDDSHVERLTGLLAHVEASIPSDPLYEEFITRGNPDVVVVTPGINFGSAQTDYIKSAKAVGIPVWMLVFSWDNLSTKGALHVAPDLMFVWNERQRREAVELHRFPGDRVVVSGAPRFDEFFALRSSISREDFLGPLGLDPALPTVLYLCSSRFVAQHELPFVRRWLEALRRSPFAPLATCNVIARPHPDIALLEPPDPGRRAEWPVLRSAGFVNRPFNDPRAIVLTTSGTTQQAFFECLFHSSAVVGLNTSGALEAGIVGRRVFTVVTDDEVVTGQSNTLHFHYLLRDNGGFVQTAPDLATHAVQLNAALTAGPDDERVRAFVRDFLRPRGDRPVSTVLADTMIDELRRVKSHGDRRTSPVDTRPAESGTLSAASRWEPAKTLRLAYPDSTLRVWATRETRKSRRPGQLLLEEQTVRWLDEHVQAGDVVYDIGAGIGAYALIAAVHREALVVAFEPEFASHKRLCDNILLNNCRRRILPLPIALSDRTRIAELTVRPDSSQSLDRTSSRPWRNRPDGLEWRFNDPVSLERLDDVVARHQLPRATHIRIAVPRAAEAILRGAVELLRPRSLKSVFVTIDPRSGSAVNDALTTAGMTAVATHDDVERAVSLFVHESRDRLQGTG